MKLFEKAQQYDKRVENTLKSAESLYGSVLEKFKGLSSRGRFILAFLLLYFVLELGNRIEALLTPWYIYMCENGTVYSIHNSRRCDYIKYSNWYGIFQILGLLDRDVWLDFHTYDMQYRISYNLELLEAIVPDKEYLDINKHKIVDGDYGIDAYVIPGSVQTKEYISTQTQHIDFLGIVETSIVEPNGISLKHLIFSASAICKYRIKGIGRSCRDEIYGVKVMAILCSNGKSLSGLFEEC